MTIPSDFPWRPRMLTTSGDTVLSVLLDPKNNAEPGEVAEARRRLGLETR